MCTDYKLYKNVTELFSYWRHIYTGIYTKIAATIFGLDVLHVFYGPITEEENRNLLQALKLNVVAYFDLHVFTLAQSNANDNDLLVFAKATKAKFTDLIKSETIKLRRFVSFKLKIKFSIERNCKTQYMEHYFSENEPHIFNRHDEDLNKKEFNRLVERTKGEIYQKINAYLLVSSFWYIILSVSLVWIHFETASILYNNMKYFV